MINKSSVKFWRHTVISLTFSSHSLFEMGDTCHQIVSWRSIWNNTLYLKYWGLTHSHIIYIYITVFYTYTFECIYLCMCFLCLFTCLPAVNVFRTPSATRRDHSKLPRTFWLIQVLKEPIWTNWCGTPSCWWVSTQPMPFWVVITHCRDTYQSSWKSDIACINHHLLNHHQPSYRYNYQFYSEMVCFVQSWGRWLLFDS